MIRAYLIRKLSTYQDGFHQESMTLQSMIQSEGDVARLFKGRYEDITQATAGSDKNSENIVKALEDRLDNKVDCIDYHRVKREEAEVAKRELEGKLLRKESETERSEKDLIQVRKRLEDEERRT